MLKKLLVCIAAMAAFLAFAPATAHAVEYSFWVAGTQVTTENASDILGDGTASYDSSTKTLTLNNLVASGAPGDNASDALIMCEFPDLTIKLVGDNVLSGTVQSCAIDCAGALTFTGSGTLYASAGSGSAASYGIAGGDGLTFASSFTGTVIAQGGTSTSKSSTGIWGEDVYVKGGTVIAIGGKTDQMRSSGVSASEGVEVTGGTLIAIGGDSNTASVGISAYGDRFSSRGGVTIARAGLVNAGLGLDEGETRRAIIASGLSLPSSSVKVAGKVGYDNGALVDTVDSTAATGIVIVPAGWTAIDSVPATLSGNAFLVNTGATPFATDATEIELNGKTALFVDLYESAVSDESLRCGLDMTADEMSVLGAGTLIAVGGVHANPAGCSYGIHFNRRLSSENANLVAIGGSSRGDSSGIVENNVPERKLNVPSGTVIGIGGAAWSGNTYYGSTGITAPIDATNKGTVIGIGGDAGLLNSIGLECVDSIRGSSKVVGVGYNAGMISTGMKTTPYEGITGTATVVAVGGNAYISSGLHSSIWVGQTASLVALGGMSGNSHGIYSYRGDLEVLGELTAAGRSTAVLLTDGEGGDCSFKHSMVAPYAYEDFYGQSTAVDLDDADSHTNTELLGYQRITTDMPFGPPEPPVEAYNLWVGGLQVTEENCTDLTAAINEAGKGTATGTVTFDPSSNTLTLEGAQIVNTDANGDDTLYSQAGIRWEEPNARLKVVVKGACSVTGPSNAMANRESYGIVAAGNLLNIDLVDGASLSVFAKANNVERNSIGIRAARLSVTGKGTLTAQGGVPSGTWSSVGYHTSTLSIGDGCTLYGLGDPSASNTVGLAYQGGVQNDQIVLAGSASALFTGDVGIRFSNSDTATVVATNWTGEVAAAGTHGFGIYGSAYTFENCKIARDPNVVDVMAWDLSESATTHRYTGSEIKVDDVREQVVVFRPHASTWTRLAGDTALDTMADIVEEGWPDGCGGTVIVATMSGYYDALAAAPLAGATDAPILLTAKKRLSPQTRTQIERMGATRAIIVGGEAAVSPDVEAELKSMLGELNVSRKDGPDAQATALKIVEAVQEEGGTSSVCVVATSKTYHDALAIAPFAYAEGAPVYLTRANGLLRDDVAQAIAGAGYTQAIIVGGEAAIPAETFEALKAATGAEPVRLAGNDAIETSSKIASWCVDEQGMSADRMGVATAGGYHDALAGAALCGRNGSVLILVNKKGTNLYGIENFVAPNAGSIIHGYVFGGPSALAESVDTALEQAVL